EPQPNIVDRAARDEDGSDPQGHRQPGPSKETALPTPNGSSPDLFARLVRHAHAFLVATHSDTSRRRRPRFARADAYSKQFQAALEYCRCDACTPEKDLSTT